MQWLRLKEERAGFGRASKNPHRSPKGETGGEYSEEEIILYWKNAALATIHINYDNFL